MLKLSSWRMGAQRRAADALRGDSATDESFAPLSLGEATTLGAAARTRTARGGLRLRRWTTVVAASAMMALSAALAVEARAQAPGATPPESQGVARESLVYKVLSANDRIEMTVNTSRILTLDQRIPQAQVNNPAMLELTPLSPTEIQISAKAPGATQVNLWGEDKKIYTIDVVVYADAQALTMLLRSQFPTASLKVIPVANGVLISGHVDRPDHVDLIVRIAEEYYPKVINNISVSGVQQVLLHVKVMEVSRTKLRRLGVDWAYLNGDNFVISGISGLLTSAGAGAIATSGSETFAFGAIEGSSALFGVLEALRQDDLAKVAAEPALVTVSGRPAQFNTGGEFPVPVPQSLGTISIEYKKYGTQLDFVPIVLGNGMIRLEVRPRVSELDRSHGFTMAGTTVPALRTREVETGVEMRAGQTLAIAGLVYSRIEAQNRGLPVISDVPYLGVPFRKVSEESNEIELLVLVTPELIEPLEASEVPACGPGLNTTSPDDCDLYLKGHLEVPVCCGNCNGAGCAACQGGAANPTPAGMIGPVEEFESMQSRSGNAALVRPTSYAPNAAANGQNRQSSSNRAKANAAGPSGAEPAFLGPIGYDAMN